MSRELDAETQALLVVSVATGNTPQEDKWLVPGLLAGLAEKSGEFLAPVWRAVPLAVCFLEAGLQVSGVPSGPHLSGGGVQHKLSWAGSHGASQRREGMLYAGHCAITSVWSHVILIDPEGHGPISEMNKPSSWRKAWPQLRLPEL